MQQKRKREGEGEEGSVRLQKKGKMEETEQQRWEVRKLMEDDRILVVLKPQGAKISLQKCDDLLLPWPRSVPAPTTPITRNKSSLKNKVYRKAEPVHRLDGGTGGLILCAKDKEANAFYKKLFEERKIKKYYRAIVKGWMENDQGEIIFHLSEKASLTTYRVVSRTFSTPPSQKITTVDLWPETGRKHQLRRHLSLVGHPILGDRRYARLRLSACGGVGLGEQGTSGNSSDATKSEEKKTREVVGGDVGEGEKSAKEDQNKSVLFLWCLGLTFPLMSEQQPTFTHPSLSITAGQEGEKGEEGEKDKGKEEQTNWKSLRLPEPELFQKLRVQE